MGETVVYNGVTFREVFPGLLRPLNPREDEALDASIVRFGIRHAICTDKNPATAGPEIVGIFEGWHRFKIAVRRELPPDEVPFDPYEGMAEGEMRKLACDLNDARRQMTAEDRKVMVEALKALGKSKRAIAAELGVSDGTVRNDLKNSGAQNYAPERSRGADGKTYPAAPPTEEQLEERRAEVVGMKKDGKTVAEISTALGISSGTVVNDLEAAELEKDAAAVDRQESERELTLAEQLKGGSRLGAACAIRCPLCAGTFRLGDATRGRKADVAGA